MPLKVIVVGAGIAGLSAAIGLARHGHEVDIYERRTGFREAENGASVQPQPNCAPIWREWGMLGELRKVAVDTGKINLKDYQKDVIATVDFSRRGPTFWAPRGVFKDVFAETAVKAGVKFHYGAGVVDVDVDKPSITLEGGEVVDGDLIVAADGSGSRIRQKLFPDYKPQVHTRATFQVALPLDKVQKDPILSNLLQGNETFVHVSPGRSIFMCPAPAQNLMDIQFNDHEYTFDQDPNPNKRNERLYDLTWLKNRFSDFPLPARKVLEVAPSAFKWRYIEVSGVPRWSSKNGKVVLIGDCVHSHTPYAGQGSGMGIESGAVLAELLKYSSSGDDLTKLLESYERIRRPRVEIMQKLALAMGDSWAEKDPKMIEMRNQMWRQGLSDPTAVERAVPDEKTFGTPGFQRWSDRYDVAEAVRKELNRARL